MEGDDEPPENEDPHNGHGGMFGPLGNIYRDECPLSLILVYCNLTGEGMPGTEHDHTMT